MRSPKKTASETQSAEKPVSLYISDLCAVDGSLPARLLLKFAAEERYSETFELLTACGPLNPETLSQLFSSIPQEIFLEPGCMAALQCQAKLSPQSKLSVAMAALCAGHEQAAAFFAKKLGHRQLRGKISLPELPFGFSRTYGSSPRHAARATLLEAACLYGRPRIAELILAADGPAQIKALNENADVRNALFFSIGANQDAQNECLAMLLNAGADPGVWRLFKDGISIEGAQKAGKLKNANALRFACAAGNAAAAKLLTAAGADPYATIPGSDFGYRSTPFLVASLLPDKAILEHFLALGPDWAHLASLAPKGEAVTYRPFHNASSNSIFAQAFEIELSSRFHGNPQALVATRMLYDCARGIDPPEEMLRWEKMGADPRVIRDCLARVDDAPSPELVLRIEQACAMLNPGVPGCPSKRAL